MPTYNFKCDQLDCKETAEVVCKMSQKRAKWPQCSEHGDMLFVYNNTNKHVDHTDTRKGFFNSHEGKHR